MTMLIEFEKVKLGYGGRTVLEEFSMTIRRGELLALVGPNGAGKTTLLRALLGTLKPLAGEMRWSNGMAPRIGYVPQREQIDTAWPLSAIDLVLMGRTALRGRFRSMTTSDLAATEKALEIAGVSQFKRTPIASLSGGQFQRVLLARALAAEPELLVLDEPTAGMDLAGSAAMLDLITKLQSERELTVILVSHDLNAVAAVADRIALIHEGRIQEGDSDAILSKKVLEEIYGIEVTVATLGDRRFVSARAGSVVIPR